MATTSTLAHRAPAGTSPMAASRPAVAAALSASAAIAHLGVMQPHWISWWVHGLFFLACGVLQAAFAVLVLWRPRTWLVLTGIAGNLAIISMYIYSRTNGSPVGPHEGVPEEPGLLDFSTTVGELALVIVLLGMLPGRVRGYAMHLVLGLAVALWAGRASGFIL